MSNFPLQKTAQQLATQGRYGDSMLVHMNPIEVDALASLSPTGQLTINPATGQPEAFLPLIGSLLAPTLLGGTALGAAVSPLVASAIGTGVGTIAEGGSLKEGITAGLMGGLTGGLMGKMMPAAGTELAAAAPDAAAAGGAAAAGAAAPSMLPAAMPANINELQSAVGSADKGFFGRLGDNLGFSGGQTPTQANPDYLTSQQAFSSQALPAAASGLMGEMYVPMDMDMPEDEDPFPYEGPYFPQEQRTMMGGFDPMSSAFSGEQNMISGNVLPEGPNFNSGGMIENYSGLGMLKNAVESGGLGILPMLHKQMNGNDEMSEEERLAAEGTVQMRYGGMIDDRLIKMAEGGSPARRQIEQSAETLDRMKQDEMIARQLQSAMAAPMSDPTGQGRMQAQSPQKTLQEVMTPQTFQSPSLAEIQEIQSRALDSRYAPISGGGSPMIRSEGSTGIADNMRQFNRDYNPIIKGIETVGPVLTKGGMEIYEAIDEFRNRK